MNREKLYLQSLKDLLVFLNIFKCIVHLAGEYMDIWNLQKLGQEKLNADELKNDWLLAKYMDVCAFWHWAAEKSKTFTF